MMKPSTNIPILSIVAVSGCGGAGEQSQLHPSDLERARLASEEPAMHIPPDCSLLDDCPAAVPDHDRCVDEESLFEVQVFGDAVVEVRPLAEAVSAAGLGEGSWYAVFADPLGGCELTVISFNVDAQGRLR